MHWLLGANQWLWSHLLCGSSLQWWWFVNHKYDHLVSLEFSSNYIKHAPSNCPSISFWNPNRFSSSIRGGFNGWSDWGGCRYGIRLMALNIYNPAVAWKYGRVSISTWWVLQYSSCGAYALSTLLLQARPSNWFTIIIAGWILLKAHDVSHVTVVHSVIWIDAFVVFRIFRQTRFARTLIVNVPGT